MGRKNGHLWLVVMLVISHLIVGAAGAAIGAISEDLNFYRRRFSRESRPLQKALNESGLNLVINSSSDGEPCIVGRLNKEDYKELVKHVRKEVADAVIKRSLLCIEVE